MVNLAKIRLSIDMMSKIDMTKIPKTGFLIGYIARVKQPSIVLKNDIPSKMPMNK